MNIHDCIDTLLLTPRMLSPKNYYVWWSAILFQQKCVAKQTENILDVTMYQILLYSEYPPTKGIDLSFTVCQLYGPNKDVSWNFNNLLRCQKFSGVISIRFVGENIFMFCRINQLDMSWQQLRYQKRCV